MNEEEKRDVTEDERPYFPGVPEELFVARMRADFPEDTEGMSDKEVRENYLNITR